MDNIELNKYLAVNLFGYTSHPERISVLVAPDGSWAAYSGKKVRGRHIPNYAGTWEGMGLVVEAMGEDRKLLPAIFAAFEGDWIAGFSTLDNPAIRWKTKAPTAPLAVARAAKAALESETVKAHDHL